MAKRPNILLIVSDQERQRDWIPEGLTLPNRQRLIDDGLEFTRHYTHSSPCSPSRASLFTGRFVSQHGVTDNVIMPADRELDPSIPTLGHLLRERWGTAPRTSASGTSRTRPLRTWSRTASPTGRATTGTSWAGPAPAWPSIRRSRSRLPIGLPRTRPTPATTGPGFSWSRSVNPHDVMWFPIDQPEYRAAHADDVTFVRSLLDSVKWKESDSLPAFTDQYDEVFDELPANFDDDLFTKPAVQRQWLYEQQHGLYGYIDPDDTKSWLRHLDYYWRLHQEGDRNLGAVLDALDGSGRGDDTAVVYTSDHGDMCGSHGLRSKGPFLYDEIMHVPLYVRVPGVTQAGTRTDALASHVDLAATITAVAGAGAPLAGRDLSGVLAEPSTPGREAVLFAQDSAWYESCIHLRYAMRGMFDGRHKYAGDYGVGGSFTQIGEPWPTPKRVDVDAGFDDFDHELYDLQEDPHELVNLANDRGARRRLRAAFDELQALEADELTPSVG